MKEQVRHIVRQALERCFADGSLNSGQVPEIIIEQPAHAEHGDFATNIAMQLARTERKPPRAVAEAVVYHLREAGELFAAVEVAGPGFINFRVSDDAWRRILPDIVGYYRSATRCRGCLRRARAVNLISNSEFQNAVSRQAAGF